jgi:hypothetical protein
MITYDRKTYFNEVKLRAAIEESRAQLKPDAVLASTIAEESGVSRRAIEKLAQTRKLWRGYHLGRLYVSRSEFSAYRPAAQGRKEKDSSVIPDGYVSVSDAGARLGIESPFPLGSFLRCNADIPRFGGGRRTYVHFASLVEAYKDPKRKGHAAMAPPQSTEPATPVAPSIVAPAAPVPLSGPTASRPDSMPSVTAFLATIEDRKTDPAVKVASPALPAPLAPAFSLSALLPTVVAELRAAGFSGTANLDMKTGKMIATRTVRVEVEL